MQTIDTQMLENSSKEVIQHITHLNMLEVFQYSYKKYGVTINDVVSMGYAHRGNPLYLALATTLSKLCKIYMRCTLVFKATEKS